MSSVASTPNATRGSGLGRSPDSFMRRVIDAPWLYRLGVLAVIGVLWELGATASNSLLIPTFTGTVLAVAQQLVDPEVWEAFRISNESLVFGFVASVVVGIPLGFAAARLSGWEGFIYPYISILLVVPMAALIPILQEAGGAFTDWRGQSRPDRGNGVGTNGWLHEEVLGILAAS